MVNIKNNDLVSIGIPFYNSERYLSDAIKSVLKQTYPHFELILIDDGSTDNSIQIAKEFEKKDKRIKVISDGKNLGLPTRLNQTVSLSTGYYYARMDADDIMFPNRIEKQVEYLINNPSVDLVGTGLLSIDNDNNITGLRKNKFSDNFTLEQVLKGPWAAHPSITGRREWFIENRYDENMKKAQDYELWIRTVEKSSFVRLFEPYLFYREASTPSLKKYFESTKYSLNIYSKNKSRIGFFKVLKLSIVKILKLKVYFAYSLLGSTDKLIQKRAKPLDDNDKENYKELMLEILK